MKGRSLDFLNIILIVIGIWNDHLHHFQYRSSEELKQSLLIKSTAKLEDFYHTKISIRITDQSQI